MLKIENEEVVGLEHAIRGMRNPMNSWDKSDSDFEWEYKIGPNDLDLMNRLVKAGTDHSKFMRMITVYCDITAPIYWWKEYDTYKVGTVANSTSTMHKIHAKEFTLDDFSYEHISRSAMSVMLVIIDELNKHRVEYNNTKDKEMWYSMIQLLPESYNQKRTVMLNYQVLRNIYHSRKNHKLDEWHTFCDWIESLPYSQLITYSCDNAERP